MMKNDGAHKGSNPPALKSLPPTNEALEMNIRRAHYTAILWNEFLMYAKYGSLQIWLGNSQQVFDAHQAS